MILTHRDQFILRSLARFHLTPALLVALSETYRNRAGERRPFTSLQNVSRRLKQLADARLITSQPLYCFGRTYCYRLTRKGAKCIFSPDEYEQEKRSKVFFSGFRVSNEAHVLATSLVSVKLALDTNRAGLTFPLFVRDGDFVSEVLIDDRKRKLIPDGTAVLVREGRADLFFLEIDLSTETRSIIADKIRKYVAFDQLHPKITLHHRDQGFACSGFRVLTFCKSAQRLQSLVDTVTATVPRRKYRMFHFATFDRMLNEPEISARNSFVDASVLTDLDFTTSKGRSRLYGSL